MANVSIESGKRAMQYFLSLKQKPDAVFAAEDFTALGVMKGIKKHTILKYLKSLVYLVLPMNYLLNILRQHFQL